MGKLSTGNEYHLGIGKSMTLLKWAAPFLWIQKRDLLYAKTSIVGMIKYRIFTLKTGWIKKKL